jgi:hypothetical protein
LLLRCGCGIIGDLGDVPLHLLEPVLCQCSAQQLAAIQDETRYSLHCCPNLFSCLAICRPHCIRLCIIWAHSCPQHVESFGCAQQLIITPECSAGGRDISTELDPHWQRHVSGRFEHPNARDGSRRTGQSQSTSRQIDLHATVGSSSSNCNWRSVYDNRAREHAEKQQRVRDKVQQLFHAERAAKQQRSAQVGISICCHGDHDSV